MTIHEIDSAPDFTTTYAEGHFSERALVVTTAFGFDAPREARTAALPIGGRLHEARDMCRLVSSNDFVLGVVDSGYKIQWASKQLQVPHEGRNPPTSEEGKKILDKEVEAMLKKGAIRIADLLVDGAISRFYCATKKD